MKRILITGAAGGIGRLLREHFVGRYPLLRLADIARQAPARDGEEIVVADNGDLDALARAMQGIDCVVHLGGVSVEDSWEKILPANIEGCYNAFEVARQQKVRRVIFASSNHAVGFHRRTSLLDDQVTMRPDTRYGVSKVFGEAVGRLYADKYGMSVASLRIGTCRSPDRPGEARHLSTWISHRDMAQLIGRCIDHPSYHYLVAYGVSNNRRSLWRNDAVSFLGYQPQDDAETYADEILGAHVSDDPVGGLFHGGPFCSDEFSGDRGLID